MRISRSSVALALGVVTAAAACGDDDGGGSSHAEPIAASELCTAYLDGLCDANQRCCTTPSFASKETCIAENMAECQMSLGTLAMDARTGYDPAFAGELLHDIGHFTEDCDPTIVEAAEDLQTFFRGTVPEGGDCSITSLMDFAPAVSCQQPLACRLRASGLMAMGTCSPKVGAGAECANHSECNDDLRCDKAPVDDLGACATRLALGSPCEDDRDCQSAQCIEDVCVAPTQEGVYCEIGGM